MKTSKGFDLLFARPDVDVTHHASGNDYYLKIGKSSTLIYGWQSQLDVLRVFLHNSKNPIYVKVVGGKYSGSSGMLRKTWHSINLQISDTLHIILPAICNIEIVEFAKCVAVNNKYHEPIVDWFGNTFDIGDAIAISRGSIAFGIYNGLSEMSGKIKVSMVSGSKYKEVEVSRSACINLTKLDTTKTKSIMLAKMLEKSR